jgi:nickel/cobalt transporter (NiCoT) family protein
VWVWVFAAFRDKPVLLGISSLIYGLGLRHAVDADHIAAIDNVTRKLMQENKRPVAVGFFFAMGHSAIVFLLAAFVAGAATVLSCLDRLKDVGGTISTCVSALFLLAIAAMNIVIFVSILKSYRHLGADGEHRSEDLDMLVNNCGFLSRIFRPLFRLVTESWHMFPLGFLFGLGFDTATEIAMFGVSAAQAANGVSFAAILAFPLLFAAGMSLVDTTDGVLMLGAYDWAFVKPMRKLYYNMTITLVSAMVALLIGGIEALGLLRDRFSLVGTFWSAIVTLNNSFNGLGLVTVGVFLAAWGLSYLVYRVRKIDESSAR